MHVTRRFGPGWVWEMLVALGLLLVTVGSVAVVFEMTKPWPDEADPAQVLWHLFELGDLRD